MSEYVPNTSLIRVCDRGYQQIANGLCEACNPGKLGGQVCVCLNPLPKPQA